MSLLLDALKKAAEEKKRQENKSVEKSRECEAETQASADDTEVSGAHPRISLEESIDEWSLEDDDVKKEVPAYHEVENMLEAKSEAWDEDASSPEAISLRRNMREQSAQYQGSPGKASQVFGSHITDSEKKKRFVLIIILVVSLGIVGSLFSYDYITSSSDERLAKYRPIRPLSKEKSVALDDRLPATKRKKAVLLVEQENYNTLFNSSKENARVTSEDKVAFVKPKAAVPKRKRLSIAKQVSKGTVYDVLILGFNAYVQGDYIAAKSAYRRVLQSEKNNRDALLGIAAIAMRESEFVVAREYYEKLLRLDPRDSHASSGLNNLLSLENKSENSLDREVQLKKLLEQKPDSHELHYALGSAYSSQQQWAQAQSHYYAAYSLDKQNADYVYNVAVSLDHLGQQQAAIQFYQAALSLSATRLSVFSAADVTERIIVLQNIRAQNND